MKTQITQLLSALIMLLPGMLAGQHHQAAEQGSDCCGITTSRYDASRASTTDTVFCESWNYQVEGWVPGSITVNTRDEYGRLTEAVSLVFKSETQMYDPISRYNYTYYINDSLESVSLFLFNPDLNGGTWDPLDFTTYEYDDNDFLVYTENMFSQYGSLEWLPGNKEYYYNNVYGMPDSIITKSWNAVQNAWYYYRRYRYEYDAQMQLAAEYHDWGNNPEPVFLPDERFLYVHGEDENQLRRIEQYHQSGEWVNYQRALTTFDTYGKKLSVVYQQWDPPNGMWDTLVMSRDVYAYNAEGLLSEYKQQSYYIGWMNTQRLLWEYDADGNMALRTSQQWDSYYEVWRNQLRCHFPPPPSLTGIQIPSVGDDKIVVSPNPVVSSFRISGSKNHITRIEMYNQTGQQLKSFRNTTTTFDISEFPAGIYFLNVVTPGPTYRIKLIKQ